jgi:hypothetical protein
MIFKPVCMGRSSGLEDSYLKLTEEQILEGNDKMVGNIGAIDDLTIDESNILRRKVKTMEIRADKLDELINGVKHLRSCSERFDKFLAQTDELQKK